MFRAVALGYRAGMIVDRLRARKEYEELPFGVCETEQLLKEMNAMYSNNMPEYYKAGTFSFHKSTHEY